MGYNEQNAVAFLIFGVIIFVMYRDNPKTASIIVIGMFTYLFLAGRLPVGVDFVGN